MPVLVLIITSSCSIVGIFVITDKQTVSEIKSVLRLHLYNFPFSDAVVDNSWRQVASQSKLFAFRFNVCGSSV